MTIRITKALALRFDDFLARRPDLTRVKVWRLAERRWNRCGMKNVEIMPNRKSPKKLRKSTNFEARREVPDDFSGKYSAATLRVMLDWVLTPIEQRQDERRPLSPVWRGEVLHQTNKQNRRR